MKLNSLQLSNFRQHADSRFNFESGLTGIIGPNGSGKSTVLEAVAWALYGQPAARGTKDSIRFVRAGARASVRVELDFELAGHRYRIVRGLHDAELYLDGGAEPIANSISAVGDMVQRRLGMTRAEFFHTYFTGQKELNVMSAMGAADRGRFLSRVLGYDKLGVAQELVRERRSVLSAEHKGLRGAMQDPDVARLALAAATARAAESAVLAARAKATESSHAARLAELAPSWLQMQQARDQHQHLSGELRVLESEIGARSREIDRLAREFESTAAARQELTRITAELVPLAPVAAEFQRFEELAREEGRRQTLTDALRNLADELAQKRDRRERIDRAPELEEEVTVNLESKRREVEDVLGVIEGLRTDWVRDKQEAETKRQALLSQHTDFKAQREQLVNLGEEGKCPTCTRVLGTSFRAVLDQLDEQLDLVVVDGRYWRTKLEQLEQTPPDIVKLEEQRRELQREVSELERQLARVQSAVQELSTLAREVSAKEQRREQLQRELESIPSGYDVARHEALRREADRLAPLNDRATRLSTLLEREGETVAERDQVAADLAQRQQNATDLQSRRDAIRFSEDDYVSLRSAQQNAADLARTAELAFATARAGHDGDLREVESAQRTQADAEKAQAKVDALTKERKLHDELDRAYSDLRTDLNHALRPELSELASAFLAELTDHRYSELELDDEYNLVVLEDGRPKPVISGGEEDLANLVLRLAISQMIAERAGQSFSLLVLDEVFGSLDDVRRHNVVELLRRLQDRFEQVILITHIDAVREGMDRVISIQYDEETGSSMVKHVLSGAPDVDGLGEMLVATGADA